MNKQVVVFLLFVCHGGEVMLLEVVPGSTSGFEDSNCGQECVFVHLKYSSSRVSHILD